MPRWPGIPEVYASPVKEPKFYLCGEAPPPAYRGPGDAHSQQEWVWRRADYEQLFAAAPADSVRIESTPFYLYDADARRRIADELPEAKFIAIVRDPIDRAYSNWMHLWVDGLEPRRRLRRGVRAGGRPDRGRLGAVLALPADGALRRAAGRPVQPGRPVAGSGASLPRAGGRAGRDPGSGLPIPRARGGPDRSDATGQLPPVRRTRTADRRARPGDPRRSVRGQLRRRRRSGGRPASRWSPHCTSAAPSSGRSWIRSSGWPCCRPAPTTSAVLEEVLGESFADWRSAVGRGSFKERAAKPA